MTAQLEQLEVTGPDYRLFVGDARATGLPDRSVDLVFGSPPYEDARTYGIGFALEGQAWVDFMVAVIREGLRVSRGLVAMVLEGRTEDYRWSATPALLMADLHRAGITLRKPPLYVRVGIPGSGGPDWLRNDYEFIVCATNGGKLPWSDNTAMGHPPKWAPGGEMSHRLTDGSRRNQWGSSYDKPCNPRKPSGNREGAKTRPSHRMVQTKPRDGMHDQTTPYTEPAKANPGNVINERYTAEEVAAMLQADGDVRRYKVGGGLMGHDLAHENEAPFPETLADFYVRSFCPPGGTVLDVFSGSGTTAAAAVKAGRKAIGIDIRRSQIELGHKRLQSIDPLFSGGAA